MTKHSTHRASTARPIQIGLLVVLAVFLAGALSAFAFGYTTPRAAEAQVMVSSVTVTAGGTAASSLSSAITSGVIASVSSVVSAVTASVTAANTAGNTVDPVTVQGSNQSTGSGAGQTATPPASTATTVSSVTVTAQQQNDGAGTSPATTDTSGVTTVSGVTVVAATQDTAGATNVTTQPCCTLTTPPVTTLPVTTPTVILPPVVVPPITHTTPPVTTLPVTTPTVILPPVVVPPITHTTVPACTLTASASSVAPGSSVQLTWTSQNLASGSINNGIGAVSPLSGGSKSVVVNANTTYTFTGVSTDGQTVNCSAPVTVTTHPNTPACTLTASASRVAPGTPVTLTWTTQNVTSGSINNGVGNATPIATGSRSAVVNSDTTYTLTALGTNGQTVTCSAPVTVTTGGGGNGPACTLAASASSVTRGASVDLTWTTTNAASAAIDQGVGAASPLAGGTKSVTVNDNTTYTMTVVGTNGQTITCAAPVKITTGGGGGGPACTLTADPVSVQNGGSTVLTWGGTNIVSVFIDQDVGTTTSPSGSKSVTVNGVGEHTYTGTFTTTSNTTLTCTAKVTVIGGGGGCTSGCGGGGGGGGGPRILFSSLKNPGEQDLAFVYLSQIPYTGLELGPWGTALYWIMLILWSLAAAYLVFFTALPFAFQRAGTFGSKVKEALNTTAHTDTHAVAHSAHSAQAAHAHQASTAHGHDAHAAHGSHGGHDAHGHHAPVEPPKPTLAKDGFRAFGSTGALSIDDIVKGLAREAAAHPEASAHDLPADFAHTDVHAHSAVAPVAHAEEAHAPSVVHHEPAPVQTLVAHTPVAVSHDVRDFLAALIAGDREAVFGTIRGITRQGGDSEEFLTHAVCALDDAYRAQVDGSVCHPDIKAITSHCHPSFLERLVTSLTTAVDGSYSTGVTGVKLALTRALAVVNG